MPKAVDYEGEKSKYLGEGESINNYESKYRSGKEEKNLVTLNFM